MDVTGTATPLEIDVATLAAWRAGAEAHALLDVREPWECETASLTGALEMPMGTVPARLDDLPRDVPLVVMCHHGARSMRVVGFLRARGFANAINLAGGIDAWSRAVDPAVPAY